MLNPFRGTLPPAVAGLVLAVGIVVVTLLVSSPIPALAFLSLLLGFVAYVVCHGPHRHGP